MYHLQEECFHQKGEQNTALSLADPHVQGERQTYTLLSYSLIKCVKSQSCIPRCSWRRSHSGQKSSREGNWFLEEKRWFGKSKKTIKSVRPWPQYSVSSRGRSVHGAEVRAGALRSHWSQRVGTQVCFADTVFQKLKLVLDFRFKFYEMMKLVHDGSYHPIPMHTLSQVDCHWWGSPSICTVACLISFLLKCVCGCVHVSPCVLAPVCVVEWFGFFLFHLETSVSAPTVACGILWSWRLRTIKIIHSLIGKLTSGDVSKGNLGAQLRSMVF